MFSYLFQKIFIHFIVQQEEIIPHEKTHAAKKRHNPPME
jgi:hypothetical protein